MVVTLGTPLASHWSATGLVVSGVEEPTTRSTPSLMSSRVTSVARLGSDWVSLTTISKMRFLPPMVAPLASACCTVETM